MKVFVTLFFVAALASLVDKSVGISGGEEATLGQFPYQVGIQVVTHPYGSVFCGGSILNEEWILTAAHCVDNAEPIKILVGTTNIVDDDAKEFTVSPSRVIVHYAWNRRNYHNDIALIQLSEKLEFTDRVQPIRVPSRSQSGKTFANENGIISGWGGTSNIAPGTSPVLRWAEQLILTNADCNKEYSNTIGATQMCLAGASGPSSCLGDDGGPLAVVETDGKFTQIGLASMQRGFQCPSGWPIVFTRVSSYLDWIETTTGGAIVVN